MRKVRLDSDSRVAKRKIEREMMAWSTLWSMVKRDEVKQIKGLSVT